MKYRATNNQTAVYGERSNSVAELQKQLNAKGANIAVDSMYGPKTLEAYNKYIGNNPPPASKIDNPTPITDIKPSTKVTLPQSDAGNIYDSYNTSLTANVDAIKNNLTETYDKKLKENQDKRAKLEKQQADTLKMMDPTKRDTYEQEQKIMQNELNASELASGTIEDDFNKRRRITSELENLLNQSNALMGKEKGMPLNQRVLNSRVSNTMSDISSRAGVLEATISAIDGNISGAYNIIKHAKDTVSANWNDELNYYNTILDINQKGLLDLDAESKEIADKKVGMIESNLKRVQDTADYMKELMVDPDSAQFVADAGVKLTDSIEEINTKLAAQSTIQQVNETKNEMVKDGYIYVPFPTSTTGLVPITVGDKTMYFKPKAEKSTGGGSTTTKTNVLTPTNKTKLLGIGLTLNEINQIQSDVATYGLEKALEGLDDENVKTALTEIYGGEGETAADIDSETYLRDNLTEKELKKLADWADVSKWWRGKAKDINAFFEQAEPDQLEKIKIALDSGYTIDEIITFLNE